MSERLNIIKKIFRDEMRAKIKIQEDFRKKMNAVSFANRTAEIMTGNSLHKTQQSVEHAIKGSKIREKFYRYAHNYNIEKVEKYATKINEFDLKEMDDYSENTDTNSLFFTDTYERKTGEQSYIDLCNSNKCDYEERTKIIGIIKKIVG